MAKITLGKRPETITRTISATMPDGTLGTVEVRYKYRTRVEFGELIDLRMREARERTAADAAPAEFSVAATERDTVAANAAYIMDIADGWNLDTEFGLESVTQLCDEAPGMAQAVIDGYRAAVVEGRLGN